MTWEEMEEVVVRYIRQGVIEFCFFCPSAQHVALSGDFNGWHQTSLPMIKESDGWWKYRIKLAPGYYEFRYLADGQWYTDYAAFGVNRGPYGYNSVVKVESSKQMVDYELPQTPIQRSIQKASFKLKWTDSSSICKNGGQHNRYDRTVATQIA